jgi:hypothetical protein
VQESEARLAQVVRGEPIDTGVADHHTAPRSDLEAELDQIRHTIVDSSPALSRRQVIDRLLDRVDQPEAVLAQPLKELGLGRLTHGVSIKTVDRLDDPSIEVVNAQLGRVEETDGASPWVGWRLADEQNLDWLGAVRAPQALDLDQGIWRLSDHSGAPVDEESR